MKKDTQIKMDDELRTLLHDFINEDFEIPNNQEESPAPDGHEEGSLPFPKEEESKGTDTIADNGNHQKKTMDDVTSITIEVGPVNENGFFWSSPVEVTFRPKPKVHLGRGRFKCFFYYENFYPVCQNESVDPVEYLRNRCMKIRIYCNKVWLPGNYILLINDTLTSSVVKIDFFLDEHMKTISGKPHVCMAGGLEEAFVSNIQGMDYEWNMFAEMPGMAQFRKKVIEVRQLMLFNEIRQEMSAEIIRHCDNLLVYTHNKDIDKDILCFYQMLMLNSDHPVCTDCSTLFDPTCSNPFEPLSELLNDDTKMICLTHLNGLTSSNGKIIMQKIIRKVLDSKGEIPLWLCGSKQEIDEILNLYPSLHQFFLSDSHVEQEPYTAFELVQAFFHEIYHENIYPNSSLQDRLSRTILQGFEQGTLTNWTLNDIRCFVQEEIRPRYLQRAMKIIAEDSEPCLIEEDIPFEKLTNSISAFDESVCELNRMIGLEDVKRGINTMANHARLTIERRNKGLKTNSKLVYHSIFTGNPGTGKTTVARQLGKIYNSLGILSKGEVIAVDRTRLVGQYIGQTEDNMKIVLEEAKGNVLFIDEAYTLFSGSDDSKDFGRRVLDSLLTVLTQPNPDMLIVLAGYPKEMDAMLNMNPGLSGRFPYRYHFEDYSADQLMEIAKHLVDDEDYILTEEAVSEMQKSISETLLQKSPNFGNARWIDQFVHNGVIPAMADRIFSTGCHDFQSIEACDIRKAFEKFKPKVTGQKSHHKVAGFRAY